MFKYFSFIFCSVLGSSSLTVAQLCQLTARFEESTSKVILNWNMISYTAKTTYILLKSTDTKTWSEIVTEKLFRDHTREDVFDYDDNVSSGQKYFYRLKIIDANYKTIALSDVVTINTRSGENIWEIYPNPVSDVLHLACPENSIIKGVINVTVQDMTGKIVTRFRAASVNRKLEIPVSQLHKGIYMLRIFILDETVLNQKFVKQ